MAFNVNVLGLENERVTASFGEDRDGCPHKGTDFSSSRRPMQFTAGIYGIVLNPVGGEWGTITIAPFHESGTYVQYIHCSEIYVTAGDIVAPWTPIGKTGDTAPPGTNISGIHLHLQVNVGGNSPHACWKGRNFANPESWDTGNPLVGVWTLRERVQNGNGSIEQYSALTIAGDKPGSSAALRQQRITEVRGCRFTEESQWKNASISSRSGDGVLWTSGAGTCKGWSSCSNHRCLATKGTGPLKLLSADVLFAGQSGARFSKAKADSINLFSEFASENDISIGASSCSNVQPFPPLPSEADLTGALRAFADAHGLL